MGFWGQAFEFSLGVCPAENISKRVRKWMRTTYEGLKFCLLLLASHCVFGQVSNQEVETSSPLHLPYREVGVIN